MTVNIIGLHFIKMEMTRKGADFFKIYSKYGGIQIIKSKMKKLTLAATVLLVITSYESPSEEPQKIK